MTAGRATTIADHVDRVWTDDILPALHDYIAIPNVSVAYDPDWREHGHMDRAVELIRAGARTRTIAGLTVEVHELPGRTPADPDGGPGVRNGGSADDTVLLYGHLDKQPEMTGWRDDLGPWKPVLEGDRLYGRGGADDGYAAFASVLAIEAAQADGLQPHPLRRADRGQRGERQPRPARLPRGARRPHRLAEPGAVPRLRLPRLRAAVGHHIAARPGRRRRCASTS